MIVDQFMDNREWQPYLGLFINLTGWLAGPIIAALLLGRWLDGRYGLKPWGTLGCIGVAFIISNIGIVKESQRLMREIEQKPGDHQNQTHDDKNR